MATFEVISAAAIGGGGSGGGVESVTAGANGGLLFEGSATNPTIALPYKVYTALLSQSGTDAPVATVLQNTLGGMVVWTYSNVGSYRGTLTGVFTENKTAILIGSVDGNISNSYQPVLAYRGEVNFIQILTFSDAAAFTQEDGNLAGTTIEIRVYP